MKDKEIKYKNELINNYIGLSKEERSTWAICVDVKGGRYNQSLDWIAPIIEKIKSEGNIIEFSTLYDLYECKIISIEHKNSGQPFIFSSTSSDMLTCMYDCVIDYIEGFSQMPFKLHEKEYEGESSLVGSIDASYNELIKVFGYPNREDNCNFGLFGGNTFQR